MITQLVLQSPAHRTNLSVSNVVSKFSTVISKTDLSSKRVDTEFRPAPLTNTNLSVIGYSTSMQQKLMLSTIGAAPGPVGPPGPPGLPSEEDQMFSRRVDFEGDMIYRGEAEVGAAESDAVWRIRKIDVAVDGDVTETWANGTADFVHRWDGRYELEYS